MAKDKTTATRKTSVPPEVPEVPSASSVPTPGRDMIATKTDHPFILSEKDIDVLISTNVIPVGTPIGNIEMYARFCKDSQLSPFKRQVHLIKRPTREGDRYTIQTSIDGYRAIADRTGRYAGSEDARFDEGLSQYEMVKAGRGNPTTATVTVWKMIGSMRVGFTATAGWKEYCQTTKEGFPSSMWKKMPFAMLAKCSEALALRRAFPDELGGVYTDDEMQQAEVIDVPATIHEKPKADPVPEEKKEPKRVEVPAVDPEMMFRFTNLCQEADGALNEQHLKDIYADGKKYLSEELKKKLFDHVVAVQKKKFPSVGTKGGN